MLAGLVGTLADGTVELVRSDGRHAAHGMSAIATRNRECSSACARIDRMGVDPP